MPQLKLHKINPSFLGKVHFMLYNFVFCHNIYFLFFIGATLFLEFTNYMSKNIGCDMLVVGYNI